MQKHIWQRVIVISGITLVLCAFSQPSRAQDAGATGVPGAAAGGAMGGLGGALGGSMDRAAAAMDTPPPPPPPALSSPRKTHKKPHVKKPVHHRKHK